MNNQHYYPYPYGGYPAHGGQGNYHVGQGTAAQGQAMQAGYAGQGQFHGGGMVPQGYYPGPHDPSMAVAALQAHAVPAQQTASFFNVNNERFFKGLLIGAAATYILTNENVQRTMIKGAVKAWSMVQGGVEEVKERFQDAEAEIRAAEAVKHE